MYGGAGLSGAMTGPMPVFDRLLKRWGFVKLSRYGLVLTPEDRILSMRPTVLDDGIGARIVGWQDDDLAVAQLKPWREVPAPRAVAPIESLPVSVFTPEPPSRSVAPMAPQPQAVEDDWEWEISIARARAAAEEVEEAAHGLPAQAPSPVRPLTMVQASPRSTTPAATPRRPVTAEIAVPARPAGPTRPVALVRPAPRSQPARPAAAPAQPEAAPPARPALSPSQVASKVRPVVGSRPAAGSPPSPSSSSPSPSPRSGKTKARAVIIDDNEHREPSAELLYVQTSELRASPKPARPLAHTIPVQQEATQVIAAQPLRFAKGTSPMSSTSRGMTAVRSLEALADEPTATEISLAEHAATELMLGEYTTPNLPLSERTQPGMALPSIRGRLAR
jgi:hypothetical protein